jgi:SAM-dependent methyltransferase
VVAKTALAYDATPVPPADATIVAFTTDLDWASEEAVEVTLELFDGHGVPVTPFITHDSPAIGRRFRDRPTRVGLHPNFQVQSSHGANQTEVFDAMQALWPAARGFRSHGYVDSSNLATAARERGFRWDSNVALFMQPMLVPLEHFSGLVRFPTWWDDDTYVGKGYPPVFESLRRHLETPGLKVMNFHPIHVALNTPALDYYATHRVDGERHDGAGIAELLRELLGFVREGGFRLAYLDELFEEHERADAEASERRERPYKPGAASSPTQDTAAGYRAAGESERADKVRAEYNQRRARDRYATSPDLSLRELEISFLAEHLPPGRVIDLGCGNGYTLLSLAPRHQGEMIGVDFSETLLEGARELLATSEASQLPVRFEQSDVRELAYADESFDAAISERCLLNLPSREDQWRTIREAHRLLRPGGTYLMVEGTEDGLMRLNAVRAAVGLPEIPSISDENFSSLKFDEAELTAQLEGLFSIVETRYFSAFYLVSRVLQPLLALPGSPSFAAALNRHARGLDEAMPEAGRIGHVFGLRLVKI